MLGEVIVKEWLTQNGCISLSSDVWWPTEGERSATGFQLEKKRVQTQSMLIFMSADVIEVVEMWVWKTVSCMPDSAELYRSHGFLRRAVIKQKPYRLVCFTGWIVRGCWEIVNRKLCLRSTLKYFLTPGLSSHQTCQRVYSFWCTCRYEVIARTPEYIIPTQGNWNTTCSTQGKYLLEGYSGFGGIVCLQYWNCLRAACEL